MPKGIALVVGANRHSCDVFLDDGRHLAGRTDEKCGRIFDELAGFQVYTTTRISDVVRSSGATRWTGWTWRRALVRVRQDGGCEVRPLRKMFAGMSGEDAMVALMAALEWFADQGVAPGSPGGMGNRLWRSTLTRPVRLAMHREKRHLYGGRQEAPFPSNYKDVTYWDLTSAYPAAMAAEPYPSRIVEVAPSTAFDGCGFALATMRTEEQDWAPLPVRVGPMAVCYGWGEAEGWWTWRELRMAQENGVELAVSRSFAGVAPVDLFGPWRELARAGRAEAGPGAPLVKAATSSLWGQFAMSGDRACMVRWSDDDAKRMVRVPTPVRGMPTQQTAWLSAETAGRVRERLWREGLSMRTAIYCDTDGVMVDRSEPGPKEEGWTAKTFMEQVEIRAPQVYRHLCPECGDDHPNWHYTVAGAPTVAMAEQAFRREWARTRTGASLLMGPGQDMTVPPMHLDQARAVAS